MSKGNLNKKFKSNNNKEEIASNDTSTRLTKCNTSIEEYDFEKSMLIQMVNKEVEEMKKQYKHLSTKHDNLVGLSSNTNFKIDSIKPTRYYTLRSCLNKLNGHDEGFNDADAFDEEKFMLRDMHENNIVTYIANASIMLTDFPKWRFIQIPNYPLSNDQKYLRETLIAADFVKEKMKKKKKELKFIRILSYDTRQTREHILFRITIPGISDYDPSKMKFDKTERSFSFVVNDCFGVDFIFEKKCLANKIDPKKSTFLVSEKDLVCITVIKKKKIIWPYLEYFSPKIKNIWKQELISALSSISFSQENLVSPDIIWNVAIIMENGGTDFLNLPPDLNHVKRSFKSIDDMISYYIACISYVPMYRALVIILGGAIYSKLVSRKWNQDKSKFKLSLTVEKEKIYKYIEEIIEIIRTTAKIAVGVNLYPHNRPDKEFENYCSAIDVFPHPKYFHLRSISLVKMEKYEEAYSDAIRVLQMLGPAEGFDCMLNCLVTEIEQLQLIRALDLSYSLPFAFAVEARSEMREAELTLIRKKAFNQLKLLINVCKLISRKKFESSLPFLEQLANTSDKFKTALGLSYLIVKKYKEAYKIASLINNSKKDEITWYILGTSAYYLIDIDRAITCFKMFSEKERVYHKNIVSVVQNVKSFMGEGDHYLLSGCLSKAIHSYLKIIKCEKKNVRLLALIWLWIGNLDLRMENYSEAIQSFSNSISLTKISSVAFKLIEIANKKLKSNGFDT